jgi:large subunit ribosomal protein L18
MLNKPSRNSLRQRRHLRVRDKVAGTETRPRLSVFRSIKQIYAQLIDDQVGKTLLAVNSLDQSLREDLKGLKKTEMAKKIGVELAKKALAQGIKEVVFDRGGYRYHGRVAALAEGAREQGLQF